MPGGNARHGVKQGGVMFQFEFGLLCLGVGLIIGMALGYVAKVLINVWTEDCASSQAAGPTSLVRTIKE